MSTVEQARALWGAAAPDWIMALAEACERLGSQRAAASKINYSPAVVNTVLKGKYTGDLGRVEDAVKGAFMSETVACPVQGDIARNRCLLNQKAKFSTASPASLRLYRTCRGGCVNSRL